MTGEVKETQETNTESQEQLSDEQTLEKIETEIDEKLLGKIDDFINPKEEIPEEKLEEKKKEKAADETKEVEETKEEVKSDTTLEKEVDGETTPSIDDLKLPNRLIQAAKRNHVTDEEVLSWGDKAESVLGKLADASDAVSERLGELGRKAKVEFKPTKKEEVTTPTLKLPEDFDSEAGKQLQETINALTAEISNLRVRIAERETKSTQISDVERDKKIDGFFDKVSPDYPEFGKSDKLTSAELVMRKNVWEKADDIMTGAVFNGEDILLEDALEQSLSIYEGKNPTKVREKLVKEVTEREKHLIQRPTSKKGKSAVEKGDDAALKAIEDFLNRGKDGWE